MFTLNFLLILLLTSSYLSHDILSDRRFGIALIGLLLALLLYFPDDT